MRIPLLSQLVAGLTAYFRGAEYPTPDVTRAQQLALGQAIIAVLVVFGFDVDDDTQTLILALAATLAAALPISDAVVRHGRATHFAQIQQAKEASGVAAGSADEDAIPDLTADERARIEALRDALGTPEST